MFLFLRLLLLRDLAMSKSCQTALAIPLNSGAKTAKTLKDG